MEKTSTICMSMVHSSGTWLNGAMVPQQHYVSLTLEDPEGKIVARAALTFEQVTRALMYNGEVPCTLERYRGIDGQLIVEEVEKPKTVGTRMKERLGASRSELIKRIEDLYRDVYEIVNGGSHGKTKMKDLLSQIDTIKSHFGSNDDFAVHQAQEELETMQTQVICQLGVFLHNQHGINLGQDALKKLFVVNDNLIEDKSASVPVPVVTGYIPKQREAKDINDMTAMEVADQLDILFKKFEQAQPPSSGSPLERECQLFMSNATVKGNKVAVRYISYQGTTELELDIAKEYLKYLSTAEKFKKHYGFWRKTNGSESDK